MARGMTNLNTTNRGFWIPCEFWKVSKEDVSKNKNELVYNKISQGKFFAKMINSYDNDKTIVAQSFLFDNKSMALQTNDEIDDLNQNDIVKCFDEIWRVDSVNKKPIRNANQLDSRIRFTYYVYLRR